MKLFFLLIPFMGIYMTSALAQKKELPQSVEEKETVHYRIMPGNLLFQFN
jgi:hypothetical protein